MTYRTVYVVLLALALTLAAGTAAPAALQGAGDEAPEPMAIPPEYEYRPGGRRDPFVNPALPEDDEEADAAVPARPLGLPGVLLNEVELTAVVTSADPTLNVVVVQAPGDRIFLARPGDELLDAVIREIRSDIVIFEVKRPANTAPAAPPEIVVRPLSARPGE